MLTGRVQVLPLTRKSGKNEDMLAWAVKGIYQQSPVRGGVGRYGHGAECAQHVGSDRAHRAAGSQLLGAGKVTLRRARRLLFRRGGQG